MADSSAESSAVLRQVITSDVQSGMSNSQIVAAIEAHYPGTLLSPPARGLEGLVWAIPVVGGVLAMAAMLVFFWRRQRASRSAAASVTVGDEDRRLVEAALARVAR